MTIISGVNCENTQESIEMAAEAKEAGADGILLMPPHMWLRFGMNPNAPFQYVKDVAEGADIDIIIHLYPATSKAFYPVETLIKMCKEIDHVKCIKMGTRVTSIYEHDVRLLRQECPDISLITCHDETLCVSRRRPAVRRGSRKTERDSVSARHLQERYHEKAGPSARSGRERLGR